MRLLFVGLNFQTPQLGYILGVLSSKYRNCKG